MSVGLGDAQRRALSILSEQHASGGNPLWVMPGLTTAELAARLGCEDRRCRAIVESLEDRGEVVATKEPGEPRRVWLTEQHRRWLNNRLYVDYLHALIAGGPKSRGITCSNCGHWIETNAP